MSSNNVLKLWEASSGRCVGTLATGTVGGGLSVTTITLFGEASERLLSIGDDLGDVSSLRMWDMTTGNNVATFSIARAVDMCWLGGQRVAVICKDVQLRVYRLDALGRGCDVTATLSGPHWRTAWRVRSLPEGRVLSAAEDCTLRVWDLASQQCTATMRAPSPFNCCAYLGDGPPSPKSVKLVLGSWGKTTRDALSNKEWWKRRHTSTQDPSTYKAKNPFLPHPGLCGAHS